MWPIVPMWPILPYFTYLLGAVIDWFVCTPLGICHTFPI